MSKNTAINNIDELEFAIFCIENTATKLGKNGKDIYQMLSQKDNILNGYIIPAYEILHTQDKDYIINEVVNLIEEKRSNQ